MFSIMSLIIFSLRKSGYSGFKDLSIQTKSNVYYQYLLAEYQYHYINVTVVQKENKNATSKATFIKIPHLSHSVVASFSVTCEFKIKNGDVTVGPEGE